MTSNTRLIFKFPTILIIIIIGCVDCARRPKQLPCNDDTVKEVDRILARVNPLGNPDIEFPETVAEAMKNCRVLKRPLTILEDLNKRCMKGMFKEVVSIVVYAVKKRRGKICKKNPTSDLKDLIDSGKCVNKGRSEIEKCFNKSLDRFLGIKNVEQKLKIPLVCCEIERAKECMVKVMSGIDICTEKNRETLLNNFEGLSGGALKIACSDYGANSEKCNQLKSVNLRLKKGQKRPKSLLTPVIDLFESIGE